jgi:hypothetical protein
MVRSLSPDSLLLRVLSGSSVSLLEPTAVAVDAVVIMECVRGWGDEALGRGMGGRILSGTAGRGELDGGGGV